ncbi:MAG: SPFH domain-containing protein [Oscillospiraceae bacterium]|nr:SPFH domain-containing protein [Oscillospiraceae bacterium]
MGLIKAALGSAGGVLADQWKEYFYCDSLASTVLMVKGQKRTSKRSSNTKGSENIISNGAVIAINEGQCMMIVEQGEIVDVCAEPGEYTYDTSSEPSIFTGELGDGIVEAFRQMGKRFTFGGEAPKDQRVYYFNTKEIIGMKYGTPSPVPFRVVDDRAGIDIDINISCFGQYSFRLTNPLLFYKSIAGNVADEFDIRGSELEGQMRSEFLTALQPAFARLSAMGIRYSAILAHTKELSEAMKEELTATWGAERGIEVAKVGVNSVKASEEDEKMIKELQRNVAFMDPTRAAAHMVGAQASAMQTAAGNTAGAMTGFMGMGMAQGMGGGVNAANLFQMGQQQAQSTPAAAPAASGWKCACGQGGNSGKFCVNCGKPKPSDDGWQCACGAVNKGKFCPECGAKKPAGVPQYKCDKCGWEPEKGTKPPKFCPECGDPFDDGDIV